MLHVRLITPLDSTQQVLQLLEASPAVTHLCVNERSARKPGQGVAVVDRLRLAEDRVRPEVLQWC
jgi:hypothetical protein